MKKILTLLMVLLMVFSIGLTGCGGEPAVDDEPEMDMDAVTMVQIDSEQGVSLLLPSDLELQENLNYTNLETGENVAIVASPIDGKSMTEYTEEDILTVYQTQYEDAAIEDYQSNLDINGNLGLVVALSLTTPGGNPIVLTLVVVTDGTNDYLVNYVYGSDNLDGSLASNIDESITSIIIQ